MRKDITRQTFRGSFFAGLKRKMSLENEEEFFFSEKEEKILGSEIPIGNRLRFAPVKRHLTPLRLSYEMEIGFVESLLESCYSWVSEWKALCSYVRSLAKESQSLLTNFSLSLFRTKINFYFSIKIFRISCIVVGWATPEVFFWSATWL